MSICEEDIIVDTSTASAQRVEAESLPGPSSSGDSADYTPVRIFLYYLSRGNPGFVGNIFW